MKNTQKSHLLSAVIILIIGLVLGAQWHRLYLFPFPQLHRMKFPPPEKIVKYSKNFPLFSDRDYYDSVGDSRLNGLYLIQIPRHYGDDIIINTKKPLTVYRMISDDNYNVLLKDWTDAEIPVNLKGDSTTHTSVIKKDFPPGIIKLKPGGPVATSPILIKVHGGGGAMDSLGFKLQK